MNLPNQASLRARQHPLLIAAALAVILFCAFGIAAVMGWLPSSHGSNRNGLTDADRAALSAGLQQPGANAADTAYGAAPQAAGTQQPLATLPGQPAAAPLPGQPVSDAPAPGYAANRAPATAYAPVYPAAAPAAYGASGSQGATGSGGAEDTVPAPAPATAYVAPEAAREAYPAAPSRPARVAETESASRWCSNCGNVESIREFTTRARGSGLGAGAGAILGGLLGHQIGGGNGRSLATVAGAVGGAVVGNQVEGNMHPNHTYEIRVRLDDGHLRTFHQHSAPRWRTGDRVRIVKGSLRTA